MLILLASSFKQLYYIYSKPQCNLLLLELLLLQQAILLSILLVVMMDKIAAAGAWCFDKNR